MGGFLKKAGTTLFGGSKRDTSEPVVDPALLGQGDINEVISRIMGITGSPFQTFGNVPVGIESSPFFEDFRSALTQPFMPTGPENQLLETIMGQTSAQFARRGLGASPIAGSATAASIAPALVQLRQNRIGNLANALGKSLEGQQLGLVQRGQNIGATLDQRSNNLISLLNLLQFGKRMPVGQETIGPRAGFLNSPFVTTLMESVSKLGAAKLGGAGF